MKLPVLSDLVTPRISSVLICFIEIKSVTRDDNKGGL